MHKTAVPLELYRTVVILIHIYYCCNTRAYNCDDDADELVQILLILSANPFFSPLSFHLALCTRAHNISYVYSTINRIKEPALPKAFSSGQALNISTPSSHWLCHWHGSSSYLREVRPDFCWHIYNVVHAFDNRHSRWSSLHASARRHYCSLFLRTSLTYRFRMIYRIQRVSEKKGTSEGVARGFVCMYVFIYSPLACTSVFFIQNLYTEQKSQNTTVAHAVYPICIMYTYVGIVINIYVDCRYL